MVHTMTSIYDGRQVKRLGLDADHDTVPNRPSVPEEKGDVYSEERLSLVGPRLNYCFHILIPRTELATV